MAPFHHHFRISRVGGNHGDHQILLLRATAAMSDLGLF